MVFNTLSVGAAVTPTVIDTYFSHYLNRKPLHQKPTAHISYHEGILLIRQFLTYASHHTVEDIQNFTSQWVPSPRWIKVDEDKVPATAIEKAVKAICSQLGPGGIHKIGGQQWWQWRREGNTLKSEWIEMRRDYNKRKSNGNRSRRVMMYIHGGAYYFGSVDANRYQMQRHARKLEARVYARLADPAARYRLSPQYPFPCGLLDCLAAYIHLLSSQATSEIILAGDSAGAGMALSLMVILRDQNIPLPAGAILISPWVDLTHSFPSVAGDASSDYIPSHGFLHRPSASWPPTSPDEAHEIARSAVEQVAVEALPAKPGQDGEKQTSQEASEALTAMEAFKTVHLDGLREETLQHVEQPLPGPAHELSITIDGELVVLRDQIQMYTTNQLLCHPLVSPVMQPSLGGLPPLLILTGGGEVLRDEQIYLAHKAAHPAKYPPGEKFLDEHPGSREVIEKYKPTDVQLQVWDDLCHVAPTLSFTRPAKLMYRSIAQFGAWALARAQKTAIDIQDDDEVSVISSDSGSDVSEDSGSKAKVQIEAEVNRIGKAGLDLPPFKNHMIRQAVDRHGNITELGPPSSLSALQMAPDEVGVIKKGPVSKWLRAKKEWNTKYARDKAKVHAQRVKDMTAGYQSFGNHEVPPPSALAGRRTVGMEKEGKKARSWGMSIWSLWGSSHDEQTMEREKKVDHVESSSAGDVPREPESGAKGRPRPASRRRTITDQGQSGYRPLVGEVASPSDILRKRQERGDSPATHTEDLSTPLTEPPYVITAPHKSPIAGEEMPITTTNRPSAGPGKAFPFKLGTQLTAGGENASTVTLQSHVGVVGSSDEVNSQAEKSEL